MDFKCSTCGATVSVDNSKPRPRGKIRCVNNHEVKVPDMVFAQPKEKQPKQVDVKPNQRFL